MESDQTKAELLSAFSLDPLLSLLTKSRTPIHAQRMAMGRFEPSGRLSISQIGWFVGEEIRASYSPNELRDHGPWTLGFPPVLLEALEKVGLLVINNYDELNGSVYTTDSNGELRVLGEIPPEWRKMRASTERESGGFKIASKLVMRIQDEAGRLWGAIFFESNLPNLYQTEIGRVGDQQLKDYSEFAKVFGQHMIAIESFLSAEIAPLPDWVGSLRIADEERALVRTLREHDWLGLKLLSYARKSGSTRVGGLATMIQGEFERTAAVLAQLVEFGVLAVRDMEFTCTRKGLEILGNLESSAGIQLDPAELL